jgi:lipid-binding SYLF domain-containing protein
MKDLRVYRGRVGLLLVSLALLPGWAIAQTREDARLITATQVMQELHAAPDQGVPGWLMARAYGVAVIPEVLRAAFFLGGRHGNGVLTVRDTAGRFSSPVFVSLTGISFGSQFGAQATDLVLIFATRRSVEDFARGKLTLGGSASVAAGPLGRSGELAAGKTAEVYSYSHSRGLFAGISLDGTAVRYEVSTNRNFYGQSTNAADIIAGTVTSNSESARRFIAAVAATVPTESAGDAAAQVTPAAPAAAAPSNAPERGGGAQSFPLEDDKPGAEPK